MKWDQIFTMVNFITFLWEDPCDAPWTVYLETAAPAALELFATLYALDLQEIQKTKYERTLNPYRLRSNRKGNRGSKKVRSRWGGRLSSLVSFDPNEATGRRLSPTFRPQATKIAAGRATLFLVSGMLERLVWWWFVASMLFEFLFNWSSALLKTEACSEAGTAVCLREGGDQTISGVSPFQALAFPDVIKQRGDIVSTIFTIHPQGGQRWVAMAECSFTVVPGLGEPDVKFRIYDQNTGKTLSTGEIENARYNVPHKMALNAATSGAAALSYEVDCNGGHILTTKQTFYVMSKPLA